MNEIIKGMSEETYASRNEYIRSTLLKAVIQETLATVKGIIDGKIKIGNDAMKMGNAFHNLLLEGKRDYVIRPETYMYGKKWTRAATYCSEWEAKQTLPIVNAKEVESLEGMVAAIHAHPMLSPLLKGQCELSIFVDKVAKLKARIDLLPDDASAPVLDFKKTRSADPEEFVKQVFNLKYYMSAALYLDVLKAVGHPRKEFWFVAVEEHFPFNIYICKMKDSHPSFIRSGRREYQAAYHKLMTAMQTNSWPSYEASDAEEHLKPWMMDTLE